MDMCQINLICRPAQSLRKMASLFLLIHRGPKHDLVITYSDCQMWGCTQKWRVGRNQTNSESYASWPPFFLNTDTKFYFYLLDYKKIIISSWVFLVSAKNSSQNCVETKEVRYICRPTNVWQHYFQISFNISNFHFFFVPIICGVLLLLTICPTAQKSSNWLKHFIEINIKTIIIL